MEASNTEEETTVATVKEIQSQIEEWESHLAQVGESQQKIESRVSELETERRGLIVEARTKNNDAAKKRIAAIAGELDAANRELRDDADAVTECTNRLEPLRAELAWAKKLAEREQLRKFVAARADLDRPARIGKLVRALEEEVAGWTADKAAVGDALVAFDSRLKDVATGIRTTYPDPVGIKYLYPTKQYLQNFESQGPKIYAEALAAVEAHLLPGEPVPSDRRAYRADNHFHLHGLELYRGEIVYLLPEHAAYFVKEGLLIEVAEPEAKATEPAVTRDPQPAAEGKGKVKVFV
ncbi:MAG: hypothetical protein LAN64_05840 [Acidobacteriia bacterium]|nr:hypothetical protein [Terriglobia bacterium]